MNTRALVLALSVALASCAGVRRDAPVDSAVRAPDAWHAPTSNAQMSPPHDWWKSFDDATLDDLVGEALLHSDDIALASTRVEEARAQFHLAHAQRLPNIGFSAVGARARDLNPGFGVAEEQSAGEAELQASFDTDLFGRLKASSQAARAALLSTEDARDTVRLAVASSVASAYLTLTALDARLKIVRQTLEARRNELHVEQRRFDAGYSSALDLTQAQAELAATEQLIPATQLAIAKTENGLSVLLGRTPGAIARGTAFDQLTVPTVPVAIPSVVVRSRPDVAAAENRLAATDHALDAARAAFLPDIQLAVSGGIVGSTLIDPSHIGIWSLGGSILAPLFDSGRLQAQQDAATAQRDEAAFAYRKTVLGAFHEVEDDLAAVALDEEQDEALVRQRDVLTRTLQLATRRYREGYSSYLDQLDAQRSLLSAELALVQSHLDRFNAAVSLFQATGGGWAPTESTATAASQ